MTKNKKKRIKHKWTFLLPTGLIVCLAAGSLFAYEGLGRRDPFVPLVGVADARSGGISGILGVEDIDLQGIVMGQEGKYSAIINGEIMLEGDKTGMVQIKTIDANTVVVVFEETEFEVKLYE